jgi:preprotein translocase subunit SecD
MKYICNSLFLIIFVMCGLTSTVYAAESNLSFRLVESKYKVDDILKKGIDIDKAKYEVFAKDNTIYVISRTAQLDDKDIECNKMLGTPYYSFGHADTPDRNSQVRVKFNANGRSKLEKLTEHCIGKGLAIVFE